MKLSLKHLGTASIFRWNKDYLFKVLTEGRNPPIKDSKVALAFRKIDRGDFVPLQQKEFAYQDIDLEIGFGEKFSRPTVLGQMAEMMQIKFGGNYLDIGTGTGYFATILGYLVGDGGTVYTMERIQWLWEFAKKNQQKYKDNIKNITFLYRDGTEGLPQKAPYDGIHVAFAMKDVPHTLKIQLKSPGGILVCPTNDYNIRVITRLDLEEFEEEIIPGFTFDEGKVGIA